MKQHACKLKLQSTHTWVNDNVLVFCLDRLFTTSFAIESIKSLWADKNILCIYVYVYICEIVCVGGGGKGMLCREERKRYKTHQNQITTKKKNKNICFLPLRVEMPTIKKKSYKHCKRGSTYPMIYQMRGKKKEHKNVMHSYYRLWCQASKHDNLEASVPRN